MAPDGRYRGGDPAGEARPVLSPLDSTATGDGTAEAPPPSLPTPEDVAKLLAVVKAAAEFAAVTDEHLDDYNTGFAEWVALDDALKALFEEDEDE